MADIHNTLREIEKFDKLQQRDQWVNRIHPLVKVLLTVFYIAIVVSFSKYQLIAILSMSIYPIFMFNMGELSFRDSLHRLRIILPIVCIVGIFNPFFDREVITMVGQLPITGGVLSMLTLMVKVVLTVLAAYLLIATTGIEDICYALRMVHIPKILVTIMLLIYRYIYILLEEAGRIVTAYKLRAPKQKGIAYQAWGSLIGQLLLRSMDRAEHVYESMCLRGFRGDFIGVSKKRIRGSDLLFLMSWVAVILVLRYTAFIEWVGGLFT